MFRETTKNCAALRPWRAAVRRASDALGLIELPSTRFVEVSPRARELLGPLRPTGLQYIAADVRPGAERIGDAVVARVIDGSESRRRQWHRLDGSVVDVTVRGRAIHFDDATYGIWIARELDRAGEESPRPVRSLTSWGGGEPYGDWAEAVLDEQWRVREVRAPSHDPDRPIAEGTDLVADTHPDDLTSLLFAFAGASMNVDAPLQLRLLTNEKWSGIDAFVRRDGASWCVRFRATIERVPLPVGLDDRVVDLERRLQRIAAELEDAGVLTRVEPHQRVASPAALSALSERQREIVLRLAKGERVGTIATRMYLSPRTVRNHLSIAFSKFGVHSQQELVLLMNSDEGDETANAT